MLTKIPEEIRWAIAGVAILLVIATVVVWILRRALPDKDFSELAQRTKTWWIMALVFVLAISVSKTVSLVFMGLISYLAFKEYVSLIPLRRIDRRVLFWAYLCIPISYYWIYLGSYGMFIIFIPVYAFLLIPMRLISLSETKGFLRTAGSLHWGLMISVFCIGHAAALLLLENPADPELAKRGPGLLFTLVLLTQLNDVSQYIWGKLFGRHKIVPMVSPGKTWQGFFGGVVTTVGVSTLITPLLTPLSLEHAVYLGGIVGITGLIGDVTVSALKRDLGVKDSGSLLPGHGGILDRIDSLTYTAPFFFHFVRFFYY